MAKSRFFDFFEVLYYGNLGFDPNIDVFIHNRHKSNFPTPNNPMIIPIVDTGLKKLQFLTIESLKIAQNNKFWPGSPK